MSKEIYKVCDGHELDAEVYGYFSVKAVADSKAQRMGGIVVPITVLETLDEEERARSRFLAQNFISQGLSALKNFPADERAAALAEIGLIELQAQSVRGLDT